MEITHAQVDQCRDMLQKIKFEKSIDSGKNELDEIFNFHRERLDSAHLNFSRKIFCNVR